MASWCRKTPLKKMHHGLFKIAYFRLHPPMKALSVQGCLCKLKCIKDVKVA